MQLSITIYPTFLTSFHLLILLQHPQILVNTFFLLKTSGYSYLKSVCAHCCLNCVLRHGKGCHQLLIKCGTHLIVKALLKSGTNIQF